MIAVDARGLSFAHPIVRTAVDRAATPSARRAAHRALAAAVGGPQRAWHLAAAAQAPDEALAAELETLGYDAAQRGAPATAATALARAAELSPDRERAIGRTVAAAAMAIMAGSPARATALLDPVLADAREPGLRADVQLLRGMAIQQGGSPMAAFALLERRGGAGASRTTARAPRACSRRPGWRSSRTGRWTASRRWPSARSPSRPRKPSSCRPCCTPRRWRRWASTPARERCCGAATRRCARSTRPAPATRSSRSRRSSTSGWRTTRTPSGCSCGSSRPAASGEPSSRSRSRSRSRRACTCAAARSPRPRGSRTRRSRSARTPSAASCTR